MVKTLQNLIFFFFLITIFSCNNSNQITIEKINGSPNYEDAKLSLMEVDKIEDEYYFSFETNNYELGIQTSNEFNYNLANSDKGQHIHFIVNNDPYSDHYYENFTKKIEEGDILIAFL